MMINIVSNSNCNIDYKIVILLMYMYTLTAINLSNDLSRCENDSHHTCAKESRSRFE